MAIEDILNALATQADAEIQRIRDDASAHAKHIIDEAELDAERRHDEFVAQAERMARSDAARSVNAARMDARRAVLATRDEGVESVFSAVAARLSDVRKDAEYPALFKKFAADALGGMEGHLVARVVPGDEELARGVFAETGADIEVRGDLDASGGLIVMTADERIVRRNTLDDRLRTARRFVRSRVAEELFA